MEVVALPMVVKALEREREVDRIACTKARQRVIKISVALLSLAFAFPS